MARAVLMSLVLAGQLRSTVGVNLINPTTGMCLDLVLPCADGALARHCKRAPAANLTEGTNLQLYKCLGSANQQFELVSSGRIRNPATGLCLDVQSPCRDGRSDAECARTKAKEIQGQSNVQLWPCHNDTGTLSVAYGNQLFSFRAGGALRNLGSGLCLEARGLRDGTSNVQAGVCSGGGHQVFELETGNVTARTEELAKHVQVLQGSMSQSAEKIQKNQFLVAAVPALVFVGALLLALSLRRASGAAQSAIE